MPPSTPQDPSQDLAVSRTGRATAVAVLASAAIGVLVLWAVYSARPPLRLTFGEDHAQPAAVFTGAGRSTTFDGRHGVWITTRAVLNLRGLDRRVPWRFALDARAPAGRTRRVTVWADGVRIAEHGIADRFGTIEQVIPVNRSRTGLVLAIFASSPSGAADEDDAFLASVSAAPDGLARPPASALLSCAVASACLGLWLAWLGVPRLPAAAAVVTCAAMNALSLVQGLAVHTSFPAVLLVTDLACLGVVAAFQWIGPRGWSMVAAATASAVALHLQLLVLLNPSVTYGDAMFHVHRLQVVEGGQLFFLSSGPGGEFPYPPALYVVVLFLQRMTDLATVDALRLTLAVAVAAGGLVMYAVAAAAWGDRRALFGLVLYHVLPVGLGIQVYAFMTNAFGNVLAAAALMVAGWSRTRGSSPWVPAAVAVVFAAGAMLAHVSSAVILGGALVAVALLCLLARDHAGAAAMIAVLVVSAAIAWTTYYAHPRFLPVYRQYAGGARGAAGPADTAQPPVTPPIMRAEAHQTRWVPGWPAFAARAAAVPGYIRRYYGLAGTALALAGMLLLAPVAGSRFDRVVAGTLGACGAFLCLGVATPIDLRYYAAAYPFLAFAGGLGADRRPTWGSWLPGALLATTVVVFMFDWFRWLETPDF